MQVTEKIKFDCNYPKLQNQKFARLVAVFNDVSEELLRKKFPDLMLYDTERPDGRYYRLDQGETYMLLMFIGEKGLLFTTLRRQNEYNINKYNGSIGLCFELVVENK